MKLTEFYSSINDEYLKLYGKVYSETSNNEYNVFLEIDDELNKIVSFSCTCKYCTILLSKYNKVINKCKHINYFINCLKKIGWEINE